MIEANVPAAKFDVSITPKEIQPMTVVEILRKIETMLLEMHLVHRVKEAIENEKKVVTPSLDLNAFMKREPGLFPHLKKPPIP